MNSCVFIICWFGILPKCFEIWLKSVERNPQFDFLIITDAEYAKSLPTNVKIKKYSLIRFKEDAEKILKTEISIEKAYRICDFRPMYGLIFKDDINKYEYWGYCDLDLVFGNLENILPQSQILNYEAIFNGGHFTLIKNIEKMNTLFMKKGSLFYYKKVVKNNAIYAFDETTGIQRIAKANGISALWGISYVDADSRYSQLISRMDKTNPKYQVYYWDKGDLYRAKYEDGKCAYQKLGYIHLQKRSLEFLDDDVINADEFWIEPNGFATKKSKGLPNEEEICSHNSYMGEVQLKEEAKAYKRKKMKEIINRGVYGVYVRIMQQFASINDKDGKGENVKWVKY